jgi:hypothetical protein
MHGSQQETWFIFHQIDVIAIILCNLIQVDSKGPDDGV